jgi:hypothetical protein
MWLEVGFDSRDCMSCRQTIGSVVVVGAAVVAVVAVGRLVGVEFDPEGDVLVNSVSGWKMVGSVMAVVGARDSVSSRKMVCSVGVVVVVIGPAVVAVAIGAVGRLVGAAMWVRVAAAVAVGVVGRLVGAVMFMGAVQFVGGQSC